MIDAFYFWSDFNSFILKNQAHLWNPVDMDQIWNVKRALTCEIRWAEAGVGPNKSCSLSECSLLQAVSLIPQETSLDINCIPSYQRYGAPTLGQSFLIQEKLSYLVLSGLLDDLWTNKIG